MLKRMSAQQLRRQLDILKQLRDLHLEAYQTFLAFETIQKSKAPNHVGRDEAQQNAAALGRYRGFMNCSVRALNYDFLMTTAILFINDRDSASIPKLLNIIEQNPVTADDFRALYSAQPERLLGVERYTGLVGPDLTDVKDRLTTAQPIVAKLTPIRNKILAHRDIGSIVPEQVTYEEIHQLIETADYILSRVSQRLDMAATDYSHITQDVTEHTENLVQLLRNDH